MRLPRKYTLTLVLLACLLVGCGLNLPDQPLKGPSWDVPFKKIPIIPTKKATIKRLLPDLIEDGQPVDQPITLTIERDKELVRLGTDFADIPVLQKSGSIDFSYDPPSYGKLDVIAIDFEREITFDLGVTGLNEAMIRNGSITLEIDNQSLGDFENLTIGLYNNNLGSSNGDPSTNPIAEETIVSLLKGEKEEISLVLNDKVLEFNLAFKISGSISFDETGLVIVPGVEFDLGSIYYDLGVNIADWEEVNITLGPGGFNGLDFKFPAVNFDVGLDDYIDLDLIGDFIDLVTIDPEGIVFELVVSNPTSAALTKDILIEARNKDNSKIKDVNLRVEIPANCKDEVVPIIGLEELINCLPNKVYIPESDFLEDISTLSIYNTHDFVILMNLQLKVILNIAVDGASSQIITEYVDISEELSGLEGFLIKSTNLRFNMKSHIPFGTDVTLYLSVLPDPFNDPDAIIHTFGLPEPELDDKGKVVRAESKEYIIAIAEDTLNLLEAPFYAGIELTLLNTTGQSKQISLYADDWVEASLWGDITLTVNPHND